jgi:EAL domain-containing protein (putative c-di-GMP-specific phosphodiesterase class I)
LVIEITEGSLIADMKRAQAFARQVKNYGVRLAIDDFGTGYSSLAQLRRLPVDELKIDQLFVRDLCLGGQDDVIIRSTLWLAHQLGVSVVAEGIETQAVFNHLKALGCDMVQGYFISKPIEATQLVQWLHTQQVVVRPLGLPRLPRLSALEGGEL